MRAIVGIALAAALLALPGCGTGVPDSAREYLESQANPLDLDQPLANGAVGNVDGYRVFLVGETHTKAKDKQAEKLLVRYFHEYEGVRYPSGRPASAAACCWTTTSRRAMQKNWISIWSN